MKDLIFSVMNKFHIVLFISCVPLFTCCKNAATGPGDNSDLGQYRWYVTEVSGQEIPGLDGKRPYLEFNGGDQNTISGFSGCNRFSGSLVETSGTKLRFSPLAATKMFCDANNTETKVFDALGKVRNGKRDRQTYSLYAGDTLLMQLRGVPLPITALAGRWELISIAGQGPGFPDQYPERKPYIIFDLATGHIGGHTSCNGFSAKYTIAGDKIRFSDALKTMIACDGGGEERFLDRLNATSQFAIQGDELIFSNADGETMRLRRSP